MSTKMTPEISVIIPVYNDPEGLEVTVKSLLNQTADDEQYEILIVDNNSTDRTHDLAKDFADSAPNIRFFVEDDIQSASAARNTGIKHAEGGILAFLDADSWVDEDYIESVEQSLKKNDVMYAGLDVCVPVNEDSNTIERYNDSRAFPVEKQIKNENFAPGACMVIHREAFETLGLFDEYLMPGGDKEFGNRLAESGYDLLYEPNITVYHPPRRSLSSLLKRQFGFGRARVQLQRRHPERFTHRSLLDIRRWLPAYPWKFTANYGPDAQSTTELLFWYILHYMVKMSNNMGQIYEMYSKDDLHIE